MAGYKSFLLSDLKVFFLCLLVFLMLHFAGRAVTGPKGFAPTMPLIGLVLVYSVFVLGSLAFSKFSIFFPFYGLIALTAIGLARARSEIVMDAMMVCVGVLITFPLIVLALGVNEPLWDDMTHWLVAGQYLFREGHLPTLDLPALNHVHPIYPWARALLHAWVANFNFGFTINVSGVFNCLFMSSTFLWLPIWLKSQSKKNLGVFECIRLIALSSSLLIPWTVLLGSTLIVSSYADPIFTVCFVHIFMAIIMRSISAPVQQKVKIPSSIEIIALIAAAASIKESGIYLAGLMLGAWVLYETTITVDRTKIGYFQKWVTVNSKNVLNKSLYLLPAIALVMMWGEYASQNGIGQSYGQLGRNNLDVLDEILLSTMSKFLGRPYGLICSIILLMVLFYRNIIRQKKDNVMSGIVFFAVGFFVLSYSFQILAYLFAFTKYEASYAASFTRYMAPAGLISFMAMLLVFTNQFLHWSFHARLFSAVGTWLATLCIIFIASEKIVPEPRIEPRLRNIAESIKLSYPSGNTLRILDLEGNGFSATVIRFYLDGHMRTYYATLLPDLSQPVTNKMFKGWVDSTNFLYLLDGPANVYDLMGLSGSLKQWAENIVTSHPQNSKLLLLDLATNGDEARKLIMLLNGDFIASVKNMSEPKLDFERNIKLWVKKYDFVYVVSARQDQIALLNSLSYKNVKVLTK